MKMFGKLCCNQNLCFEFGCSELLHSNTIVECHYETEMEDEGIRSLHDSPFWILRVAERGDVEEFQLLVKKEPGKLQVRDGKGRNAVHQAAVKNHVSILEVIVTYDGDLNLSDHQGNTALHLAVEADACEAIEFLMKCKANARHLNGNLQSPLHLACTLNKPACLSIFAKFLPSLDVNQGDEHGRTALHLACIYDHEECVKILLEEMKASPRIICSHKFYPIHEAAKHGASRSLGALLTLGASNGCPREDMILFYDSEGNAPLHSAVHGGDIQTVKLCLLSGAKISVQQHDMSTAVHLACSQGALEIIKLMFTIQPEEKDFALQSCDLERMTPLHCAAMYDHSELVEYLISEGASLNVLDKNRNSPLQLAALRKAWNSAKILIRHGADAKLDDMEGQSFLHVFVKNEGIFDTIFEDISEVKTLVSVDAKDKNGFTALHLAGKHGNLHGVCNLIALGANVVAQNYEGENVFHIVCRYGRIEIVQKILKLENSNSIINEGNGNGLTPLHIAASTGHTEILKLLMSKGALFHRDYDGCTPVHLAARKGHSKAMKLILSTQSHLIDLEDKHGNTPLHIAALHNQPQAVSLLLKLGCNLSYNFAGYSAIDYALQNKFVEVVFTMVTDPKRRDGILGMTHGKHPFIMKALVAKMPIVAKAVLDQNVIPSDDKQESKKFNIKYDFKWFSEPDKEILQSNEKGHRKKKTKLPPEKIFLPVLNEMVLQQRVDLLSHDLSQKYLEMKWNSCGKYFQFLNLFLYCIYLALVTNYSVSPWTKDHQFFAKWNDLHGVTINKEEEEIFQNLFTSNETILPLAPTKDVAKEEVDFFNYLRFYYEASLEEIVDLFDFAVGFNRITIAIFVISCSMILFEFFNIWRHGLKQLLVFDTWIWYGMNFANFTMSMIQWYSGREYVNPSAALAAFLSWFYLLLILQRFDLVGIYVSMFLEILKTLFRVLLIFSVLIVAFGLAFYILLSNGSHIVFTDIPLSVMRTFSMMLGDLDFMNTFGFPHHCQIMEAQNMTSFKAYQEMPECKSSRRIPYPVMSFTMVCLYMIFNCILLVNLLIGLAVGDIDSVRRNAQLKRLAMQVHMQTNLEKSIPMLLLKRLEKSYIIEYPNNQERKLNLMEKIVEFFHPKSPPNEESQEAAQQSNEMLAALVDTNEVLEKLTKDVGSIVQWMNSVNMSLQKISHSLSTLETESSVQENNSNESLLEEITYKQFKRSSIRHIRKTPKIPRASSLSDSDSS